MKSLKLFLTILLTSISTFGTAQEVTAYFKKDINFGEFYVSGTSGGQVCISNSGVINASPAINFLTSEPHPATVIVSTTSETEIDVQIEARAQRLQGEHGGNLDLILNQPEFTYYSIRQGMPAEISLGGCLEITSEAATASGEHLGAIYISVTVINE